MREYVLEFDRLSIELKHRAAARADTAPECALALATIAESCNKLAESVNEFFLDGEVKLKSKPLKKIDVAPLSPAMAAACRAKLAQAGVDENDHAAVEQFMHAVLARQK